MPESLRILTVGAEYAAGEADAERAQWHLLVTALRERGDELRVITTEGEPAGPGVERVLGWYGRADGTWCRPPRLDSSRLGRHALRVVGDAVLRLKPDVVVWAAMGGMPLTLVGATGRPELALVHDEWPLYAPHVDPQTRRDGWDPGAVARWSVRSPGAATRLLRGADGRVEDARVHVDPAGETWLAAVVGHVDALAGR